MDYSLEKLLSLNYLDRIDELFEPAFDVWFMLHNNSKIDIDDLWEKYTIISIKTSENIAYLKQMLYTDFIRLVKNVDKYLEQENNQNNGESNSGNSGNDMFNNAMNSQKSAMKNAIPNYKSFK